MSHTLRHRLLSLMVLAGWLVSAVAPLGPAYADTKPAGPTHEEIVDRSVSKDALNERLSVQRSGLVDVVVELTDTPTTVVYAATLNNSPLSAPAGLTAIVAAQAQLQVILHAQAEMQTALENLGARVLYRNQRVYNGIAIKIDAAQLTALRQLPGVKAVHALTPKTLDNASGVPLIGAPQVWNSAGLDVSGQGISIGIIDTGIDYLHTNFGGPGTVITDTAPFTGTFVGTPKVVGGYDFAGDDYDANVSTSVPQPDPDPMDCNGHGSHVAGTAGGLGVNADGTTFTGTYGTAIDFASLRIGPGAAPNAQLYALRVFGCGGSTNLTDQAIEWAVDPNGDGDFSDHLDVINMSLGSGFGGTDDTSAVAADNAALAGVIVVASAGNNGDTNYITGSPGAASRVLSVAASEDSTSIVGGFQISAPVGIAGLYPASEASFGPNLDSTGPITGTVTYASPANGCTAITNGSAISGTIALIDRGTCTFKTKVRNAMLVGAIGVIIANNIAGDPAGMGDDATITNTITIPSIMTTQATGTLIKANIASPVTATLTSAYRNQIRSVDYARVDTIASFTSRGPRRQDNALKPDITAPGNTIFSTDVGTGSGGTSINGTSMAAPHMAGVMALLRQLHPDWTVEQLKALAMNTATNDIRTSNTVTSTIFSPARIGAGRVDVPNAAAAHAVAYNADNAGLVSVSFGAPEVVGGYTAIKNVRVANKSGSAITYNLEYLAVTSVPGVTISLPNGASVTVPANGTANVPVMLTADPTLMKYSREAALTTLQDNLTRHWLPDVSGYLVLTPAAAQFSADLSGANEVPAVSTGLNGLASFDYNSATNALTYTIALTTSTDVTVTASHIHYGLVSVNGGVAQTLYAGPDVLVNGAGVILATGTVTLTVTEERLLLGGDLYVNVHTSANPSGEVRGQILPKGEVTLRVSVYAAPRVAAQMTADDALNFGTAVTDTAVINLTGSSFLLSGTPTTGGVRPLVTGFELQAKDPNEASSAGNTNSSDIQYVGIATDAAATGGITGTTEAYIAIATYGQWDSPNEVEFDVYIDTNRDGTDDWVLFNWNYARAIGGSNASDVPVTVACPLAGGSCLIEDFVNYYTSSSGGLNTYIFNSTVMVLPFFPADLGMTTANATFDYYVVSFDRDQDGGSTDITNIMTFNAARPGVDMTDSVAGLPWWDDQNGGGVPVAYDLVNYKANRSLGILLLHHHNAAGMRAEVVNVVSNWPNTLYLPVVAR